MKLKTVLFYSHYAQLSSVIYPALLGLSFRTKYEFFCRKPLGKLAKSSENRKQDFILFFQAIMTLECIDVYCPFEEWDLTD